MTIKVAVIGAGGRMGQALIKLINQNQHTTLSGALVRAGNDKIGTDAGGVNYTDDIDSVFQIAMWRLISPAGSTATNLEHAKSTAQNWWWFNRIG